MFSKMGLRNLKIMKILHTTDLHFNEDWLKFIKSIEPEYDLICITGDFLDGFHPKGLDFQIQTTTKWLKSFSKPVFACSGNHDIGLIWDEFWLDDIENVNSDNTIKEIDGVVFGCAPYVNPKFEMFKECDVLLSHLPPAKTAVSIESNGRDCGSIKLYDVLNKGIITPKYVLSGHIHNPMDTKFKLKDTIIYNPGCDKDSKKPKIITIDI
ncbi:metallophosphoesterase [Campylobacter sp. RM16191]|uniref:metallophosphoesterase family protein n=2 Tax=unclassified Campylobacter TaxID=2593542 RepID=UPI00201648EA|nr:metallophosphoesterase [Campylobacter sp. RM16191]